MTDNGFKEITSENVIAGIKNGQASNLKEGWM